MEENEQNRLRITELERSQEKQSEMKAMTEENEMIERKENQKRKNEEIFRSSKVKEFIKGSTTQLARIKNEAERMKRGLEKELFQSALVLAKESLQKGSQELNQDWVAQIVQPEATAGKKNYAS
jgi:flagellar biosynthesis/type III secretory pathway protein FliH